MQMKRNRYDTWILQETRGRNRLLAESCDVDVLIAEALPRHRRLSHLASRPFDLTLLVVTWMPDNNRLF
jgi:hypothetical protein